MIDGRESNGDFLARGIERLRQKLERAYDGLLNHRVHTDEERDEITNEIGAELTPEARKRIGGY